MYQLRTMKNNNKNKIQKELNGVKAPDAFNSSEEMMIEEIKKVFLDFNPSSLSSEQLTNTYKTFIGINQNLPDLN